jgi:hypothetical protein
MDDQNFDRARALAVEEDAGALRGHEGHRSWTVGGGEGLAAPR